MSLFDGRAWDTNRGCDGNCIEWLRTTGGNESKGPPRDGRKRCWAKRHQRGQENVIREYRKEGVRKVVEGVGVGPVGLDSHFAKSKCVWGFYDWLGLQPGPRLDGNYFVNPTGEAMYPDQTYMRQKEASDVFLHLYMVRAEHFGPMSHQQGLPSNGMCCVSCCWCTPGQMSFSKTPVHLGVLWSVVSCQQPSSALTIFLIYSYLITGCPFYESTLMTIVFSTRETMSSLIKATAD